MQAPPGARSGAGAARRRFGLPEVYALLAAASFLVARFVPVLRLHVECPVRALTGLPCATCGMTHAFVHAAHGQLAEALRWNPFGAALALAAWAFAVLDAVRVAAGWPMPAVPERLARRVLWAGAAALVANWLFLLLHGLGA